MKIPDINITGRQAGVAFACALSFFTIWPVQTGMTLDHDLTIITEDMVRAGSISYTKQVGDTPVHVHSSRSADLFDPAVKDPVQVAESADVADISDASRLADVPVVVSDADLSAWQAHQAKLKISYPMNEFFPLDTNSALGPDGISTADIAYSEYDEAYCLALTIFWESKNEPILGQVGVGQVVLNRVADPKYPDSICEVMKERGVRDKKGGFSGCQFSWYCDGKSDIPNDRGGHWTKAKQIAVNLLNNPDMYGDIRDNNQLLFFATPSGAKGWHDKHTDHVFTIGGHKFFERKTD